ncbi:condensation domain-containing protein [Prescottella defluvii]|nr:condensation domain-containing protein [Prescottella defluvii]
MVGDTATGNGAVRMSLNTRGDGDHVLDLSLDHLVVDGGSVAVLFRDLVTAYEARLSGRAPSWDPLPLQYADYVLWERERGTDALLDRWRTSLAGFDPAVLPTGRVPAPGPASGATVEFGVDPGVVRRLEQLAARFHATEFMVLHAVLAGCSHGSPITRTWGSRPSSRLVGTSRRRPWSACSSRLSSCVRG